MLNTSSEITPVDSVESQKHSEAEITSHPQPEGRILIINAFITIRPSVSSSAICE